MDVMQKLRQFFMQLEERDFYLYLAAFFAGLFLLLGLFFWWHSSRVAYWTNQLNSTKKQRVEVKKILQDYSQFKHDQTIVKDLLATHTGFKIRQYYDTLVDKLHLASYKAKEPGEPITENLEGGAKERTITISFNNLTMEKVVDILSAIENNPLVYAKKIVIDKVTKDRPTLNVSLDIATIEATSE